jgi:hypothetical protein
MEAKPMVSVVAELMTHAVAESIARAGNVTVATPNADVVTARFESLVYRRPGDGPALSAPRYDRYGPATGGDVPAALTKRELAGVVMG